MRSVFGVLCCLGLLILVVARRGPAVEDYAGIYTGGSLVGSSSLYDRSAHLAFHTERLGIKPRPDLVSPRLPYYSFLISPLSKLRYPDALLWWRCAMAVALGAFVWLFPVGSRRDTLIAVLASDSVLLSFQMGQDVALLLPPIALALLAHRSGHPFVSGVAISLCATKYHLFVLVPVAIVARRQWRFAGGMVAGGAGLLALSCIVQGVDWFGHYITLLRQPAVNAAPDIMLGFVGLTALLPQKTALLILLDAITIAAAVFASMRHKFEVGLSACLIAAVLISPHAYLHDAVVLIPALLLIASDFPALSRAVWLQLLPAYVCVTSAVALALMGYSQVLDTVLVRSGLYVVTLMEFYVLLRIAAMPAVAGERHDRRADWLPLHISGQLRQAKAAD